jgi:hypothetical protein
MSRLLVICLKGSRWRLRRADSLNCSQDLKGRISVPQFSLISLQRSKNVHPTAGTCARLDFGEKATNVNNDAIAYLSGRFSSESIFMQVYKSTAGYCRAKSFYVGGYVPM